MHRRRQLPLVAVLVASAATPVLGQGSAIDQSSAIGLENASRVAAALIVAGFVSWGKLSLQRDGSVWIAHDAMSTDGGIYDVVIDSETLMMVEVRPR